LIAQEFEGRERATAIGAWGATVGSAVAIGPLVGGLLTDGLGWEWIFFINVPIGITAVVLSERKLVNVTATDRQPLDWAGVLTFSTGLFLLIFGLIRGNPDGWSSGLIIGTLAGAVVLLSAFIVIEAHRGARARSQDPASSVVPFPGGRSAKLPLNCNRRGFLWELPWSQLLSQTQPNPPRRAPTVSVTSGFSLP
jgi:Major Facilitator Superfamily